MKVFPIFLTDFEVMLKNSTDKILVHRLIVYSLQCLYLKFFYKAWICWKAFPSFETSLPYFLLSLEILFIFSFRLSFTLNFLTVHIMLRISSYLGF